MFSDIPSPIDLRRMKDAREWADAAMLKRPWRLDFFNSFAKELGLEACGKPIRVLELGSGPGFLAEHLLKALQPSEYVALDFSPAMHQLAAEKLGDLAHQVRFVQRSFRDESWSEGLGSFDAVVTMQSVHELRHKCRAHRLHLQVKEILGPGGSYLVCDHFAGEGGMPDNQLYMSLQEQGTALEEAGFSCVRKILVKGTLVLHHAS